MPADHRRGGADTLANLDATCTEGGSGRPAVAGATLGPGDLIDRYEIVALRGAGGMGVVYRARDPDLGRDVALKLLQADDGSGGDEAGQRRLLREAQAMARIAHPNLVTVYDVGTFRGRVFLAMEFVHGRTVTEWLRDEVRGWREVLAVFAQAGAGLAAAHAAGVVHRDFKPDNVLVGEDGRVRVADFGLARSLGEPVEPDEAATGAPDDALSSPLTRTGAVMGTPAYMAPEQHHGQPADARADQFAFAVALYEALYGVRPFPGGTHAEILASLLAGAPPSPPSVRAEVPAAVGDALLCALAIDPAERYPDVETLLAALERARKAATRRAGGWQRWLLAAAGIAILGAAGAGGYARWGGSEEPPPPPELTFADVIQMAVEGQLAESAEIRARVLSEVLGELAKPDTVAKLGRWVPDGFTAKPPRPPDLSGLPDAVRERLARRGVGAASPDAAEADAGAGDPGNSSDADPVAASDADPVAASDD
jgi:hypothetical protein